MWGPDQRSRLLYVLIHLQTLGLFLLFHPTLTPRTRTLSPLRGKVLHCLDLVVFLYQSHRELAQSLVVEDERYLCWSNFQRCCHSFQSLRHTLWYIRIGSPQSSQLTSTVLVLYCCDRKINFLCSTWDQLQSITTQAKWLYQTICLPRDTSPSQTNSSRGYCAQQGLLALLELLVEGNLCSFIDYLKMRLRCRLFWVWYPSCTKFCKELLFPASLCQLNSYSLPWCYERFQNHLAPLWISANWHWWFLCRSRVPWSRLCSSQYRSESTLLRISLVADCTDLKINNTMPGLSSRVLSVLLWLQRWNHTGLSCILACACNTCLCSKTP